ncbi:hypothetical protein RHSIM_Rhsim06G0088800 [Rhododendron simsii]|uniref:Uncharacterized protein n=1 Tax=Rhododendron simsii TaxID=118357 RepID=A0A834GT89_RHOSS|nr:hypothetical protein RHSIM_Rhsim06G0088800 [Rhododendron simsii]
MSFQVLQVRRGHSVKGSPKVAYTLMNGTLLPRDAQELPKDLEAALGSVCQLHIWTEVATYKKEVSNATTTSLAYKQKLEELTTKQQKLLHAAGAKGYHKGMTDKTRHYKAQVERLQDKACDVGYIFGLKAAGVVESSELYKAMPKYPKQKPIAASTAGPTAAVAPKDVTPRDETTGKDAGRTDSPTDPTADPKNP